jgi:hypothetical protein
MINFSSLTQNPTLMMVVTIELMCIIAMCIGLAVILIRQKNCHLKLCDIATSVSNLGDSLVRANLNLQGMNDKLQSLDVQYAALSENYEQTKVELSRLAQNMGGESQLTKAIDLARGGADVKAIVLTTGLGNDEAQAIVKFHGSLKR